MSNPLCPHCDKEMPEGEYLSGPNVTGTFFYCNNGKCQFFIEEGEQYTEDYDYENALEVAAEMALESRNDK